MYYICCNYYLHCFFLICIINLFYVISPKIFMLKFIFVKQQCCVL